MVIHSKVYLGYYWRAYVITIASVKYDIYGFLNVEVFYLREFDGNIFTLFVFEIVKNVLRKCLF